MGSGKMPREKRCSHGIPTVDKMDHAQLVARIDTLLRQSPPPPPHVLEDVLKALRGGGGGAPALAPVASSSFAERSFLSSAVSSSSERRKPSRDVEPPEYEALSLKGLGNDNPKRLAALIRFEARCAAGVPKYENVREKKVAQFQALLEGQGGKYTHADYMENGTTQIAGMTTYTPSMTADPNDLAMMSKVKGKLTTRTYCHKDNAFNFRP